MVVLGKESWRVWYNRILSESFVEVSTMFNACKVLVVVLGSVVLPGGVMAQGAGGPGSQNVGNRWNNQWNNRWANPTNGPSNSPANSAANTASNNRYDNQWNNWQNRATSGSTPWANGWNNPWFNSSNQGGMTYDQRMNNGYYTQFDRSYPGNYGPNVLVYPGRYYNGGY